MSSQLVRHLAIPYAARDAAWRDSFYKLAKAGGKYLPMGHQKAPDGFPYLWVHLVGDDYAGAHSSFDEIASIAFDATSGIILCLDPEKGSNAILDYGSIWAYREYGYLEGAPNQVADFEQATKVNPANPFEARLSDSRQITIGHASEAFLPLYVRDAMTNAIREHIPAAMPEYHIHQQQSHVMATSILVTIGAPYPEMLYRSLGLMLAWYLPPYLPPILAPSKSA